MDGKRFDTVVIGGGQAGLAVGYHLAKQERSFVILDAYERVGDAWRRRWDSLRLFTPRRYDGLPGLPFPGDRYSAPTKDEMADYLEAYAEHFELPVRTGVLVRRVSKQDGSFTVETSEGILTARHVVVATGAQYTPRIPEFAPKLDPRIVQMHSSEYRRASQLQEGAVLIVGAGNAGADISLDVVRTHRTILVGRHPGHVPFHIDTFKARFLIPIVRFVGLHVLSMGTPIGRKLRPKLLAGGDPLVRVKPKEILAAGVDRVKQRVTGVKDGLPVLDDGTILEVANVIWATGAREVYPWIDVPVFDEAGAPIHTRGVVNEEPALCFVGINFQYAAASETITGVRREAEFIVKHIASSRARSKAASGAASVQ